MSQPSDHPGPASGAHEPMDADAVRRVARLCLLDIPDDRSASIGQQLSAVLGYIERLHSMDLDGAEPMAHVGDRDAPLADDVPGPVLDPSVLASLARDDESRLHREPGAADDEGVPGPDVLFVRVPKVIGGAGGSGSES